MLKNIVKLLLIVLLIAGIGLGIAWLILFKGIPWWAGLSIVLGLLGIWIGVLYIKKLFLRRREKEFVHQVIKQDEQAISSAPIHERENLQDLQAKWKDSIDLVRHSYLRKHGNPLYVLPWYLILGESGSGKTSAIKYSNLNSPMTEVKRTEAISVTKNCDWWFFEKAIILDTAGRYTIPIDGGVDKDEWEKFLTLLAKYRRREPINGVIVTIAADKLQEKDEAKLRDEGQSVRRRINQLMRILGARFPIYVMVTKMDMVLGMVEFTNLLPGPLADQALGYVTTDDESDCLKILSNTFSSIADKLKDLTLLLIHQGNLPEPEIFLFSKGVESLQQGLKYFIPGVFETNPYQETPQFRGLFLSSAIQEKRLRPNASIFGVSSDAEDQAHNNGLFLKDFFKQILPGDRYLFSPLPEYVSWRHITRNLGFLSWLLVWLCLCGLMSFSYLNNVSALKTVLEKGKNSPVITKNIADDLVTLTALRSKLETLGNKNNRWVLPYIGFNNSNVVEVKMKIRYMQLFRDEVLYPFDNAIINKIENTGIDSDDYTLLNYFEFLTARISLLKERCNKNEPYSTERFATISSTLLTKDDDIPVNDASLLSENYNYYLSWNENTREFEEQLAKYQKVMDTLLGQENNLNTILLASISEGPDIHLSQFWEGNKSDDSRDEFKIPGLYTQETQKQIESFFTALESIVDNSSVIQGEKDKFYKLYQGQFYDAWKSFANHFYMDINDMEKGANLHHIANVMTTDVNPFFMLIETMAQEFSALHQIEQEPPWVDFIIYLQEIRKQAVTEKEKQKGTLLGKIESKKEILVQTTLGKIDKKKAVDAELLQRQSVIWGEYTDALKNIASSLGSREKCFQILSDFNMSPFSLADTKITQIMNLLESKGDFPFIWELAVGPKNFLISYCARETTYILQEQWEEQVLGGIAGANAENIPQLLFNKTEGLIWKYMDTAGKSFITRSSYGYRPRKQFEKIIPFKSDFFNFLDMGTETVMNYQPMYYVTIETLPLDVNNEATTIPFGCILSMQSSEQQFVLGNYNYPQKLTFNWSNDNCGDVTLSILFTDMTLAKVYKGKMGFANFLSDFRDGSRTFAIEEFPEHIDELKKMKIEDIKVSYKITGGQPVIQLLQKTITGVPQVIVTIESG